MKKTFILFMCILQIILTLNVSAQNEKNITLNVPIVNYSTKEITISGSLNQFTYSIWNDAKITLLVIEHGATPLEAQTDNSLIFNVAEFAPDRSGAFTYTFEHNFKQIFDSCSVYVNYSGYAAARTDYRIGSADYDELLEGRVLLSLNAPVYYKNGEKLESEILPYSDETDTYIPAIAVNENASENAYLAVSGIENANVYESYGIICIGSQITDVQAGSLQPLFGIHVSKDGNDNSDGTAIAPVKTVARALRLYRDGISEDVFIHEGVYEETLSLDSEYSGIRIKGIGEAVIKPQTVKIPASEFKLVQDEEILDSLPHTARGSVLCAPLSDCQINFPDLSLGILSQNESYYKVYQGDSELANSRYPNGGGFTMASSALTDTQTSGTIYYDDTEKLSLWNNAEDARIMIFRSSGYYIADGDILSINASNNSIALGNLSRNPQNLGKRFFVYNLLEELDAPGEWYIDRENEKIYCFPLDGFSGLEIAKSADSIIEISGVNNAVIENLTVERTRGTGIEIKNSNAVEILGCKVQSIGKYGIFADNVINTVIDGCEVCNISKGGIYVNYKAYHDPDLTVQNNIIRNCNVYNIGTENLVAGGIYLGGTGNSISHNTIHDTPHMAIWFDGNDNTVEYNEIYNSIKYCDDAGVIYTNAGMLGQGSIVQYNYIHDCTNLNSEPPELYMIYLDYTTSGITVRNNIFDAGANTRFAFGLFGGGRNNVLESNVFKGDTAFILSSRYQSGTMHDALIEGRGLPDYIDSLTAAQKTLWFEKYPSIQEEYNYYKNGQNSSIGVPRNCRIENNIFVSSNYSGRSENSCEYIAFGKSKSSAGFKSTNNNGIISGNTYTTQVNLQDYPASGAGAETGGASGEALQIIYPKNNMTVESGTRRIVWDKEIGAQKYLVQIYRANNLSATVFETETIENFVDASLSEGSYVLKITANKPGGNVQSTAEFECKDTVIYISSGSAQNTACDAILYVSVPGSSNITAYVRDGNSNPVNYGISSQSAEGRDIIKLKPQALLKAESNYTLVLSNNVQKTFGTGKLINAEAVFETANGETAINMTVKSMLERNSIDANVIFAGKTNEGVLENIEILPISLAPQQSRSTEGTVGNGLRAEAYVWKGFDSISPLENKISSNN